MEDGPAEDAAAPAPAQVEREFSVFSQRVELDISLRGRSLKGTTELLVVPSSRTLKTIRLHCRQASVSRVLVQGKSAAFEYDDPYESLLPHKSFGVHQHHIVRDRLQPQLRENPEEELVITLPRGVVVQDMGADMPGLQNTSGRGMKDATELSGSLEVPGAASTVDFGEGFALLKINIDFEITNIRDGLHFVGWNDGDGRYPHVYTRNSSHAGTACCLFPCVDDPLSRCSWEICIRCPRTLGDAYSLQHRNDTVKVTKSAKHHESGRRDNAHDSTDWTEFGLTEAEANLELVVVCSGETTDEVCNFNVQNAADLLTVQDCRS